MSESAATPRVSRRLTRAEVGRIVNAARILIEANERRSLTSEHATLGEEGAMWELNFQLGMFRYSLGNDDGEA